MERRQRLRRGAKKACEQSKEITRYDLLVFVNEAIRIHRLWYNYPHKWLCSHFVNDVFIEKAIRIQRLMGTGYKLALEYLQREESMAKIPMGLQTPSLPSWEAA